VKDSPGSEVLVREAGAEPVKIVMERRVRPGAHQAFGHWLQELLTAAARAPRHRGTSVFQAGTDDYFILLRFASPQDLEGWRASEETAELLRRGDQHATAPGPVHLASGLETWFTVPGRPVASLPPPRWKMALVTWLALLPQALLLGRVLPPQLPALAKVAVSTALPVAMLTWVLMPRLTRWLYPWLYAGRAGSPPST
jgi:uncharacterized protein